MPRLSHSVPKYCRHKASGQGVVTLDGIDFYLGPYGSKASKSEYERRVGEWLACGRRLPPKSAINGLTVVELAAAYLTYAEQFYRKDGKPTSTLLRVKAALRVLCETYGDTSVTDFGPLALQSIQHRLVSQQKSRRYVNYLIEEIKRVFRWGVRQELITSSIWHGLSAVSGLRKGRSKAREPAPVAPVADATFNATLPYLPAVVADMVRFQRLTVCRPGEICIIRPAEVDTAGPVWRFVPAHHKTEHHGKPRVIMIGPKAQDIPRPYLLRPADAYCFSPRDSLKKHLQQRHDARVTPVNQGNVPRTNRRRSSKRTPGARFTTK